MGHAAGCKGALKRLVHALRYRPKALETRLAFRALVDSIVVHPERKRMPYEYAPYFNRDALFGMKLFPENRRKPMEIAASARYDNVGREKSVSS